MSDLESPIAVREGLPPTYRMRAESHYVDLLEARASEPRERSSTPVSGAPGALIDTPPVDPPTDPARITVRTDGLAATPALEPDVLPIAFADATLHAGRDLAQSLSALAACADLLSNSPSELSRAVVGNLIRAEVWRASVVLHATRIVRRELAIARAAVSVSGVLDRVAQGFLPERRVRAIRLETRCDLPHGVFIAGDEQLLSGALSCGMFATLAVLDGFQDARIVVSATLDPAHHVTFAVTQEVLIVPPAWQVRAFDPTWLDRPGGVPAVVSMLAVQQAAAVHGGSASAGATGRGTTISITVPIGL